MQLSTVESADRRSIKREWALSLTLNRLQKVLISQMYKNDSTETNRFWKKVFYFDFRDFYVQLEGYSIYWLIEGGKLEVLFYGF